MAEVAGLVIGGVSLAALFDSTISCFERIQVGREFGQKFPRYQNDLQVLELRLGRWSNAVNQLSEAEDPSISKAKSPLVEEILNDLKNCLEKAERQSKRFGTAPAPNKDAMAQALNSEALAKVMHKITLKRLRIKQFRNQTKWAIYGEKEFNKLISDIGDEVENLEKIFPIDNLNKLLAKMRIEDAEDLSTDSNIDDASLALVKQSAQAHDPQWEKPIEQVLVQRVSGNIYRDNHADGNASYGTYVAADYKGPFVEAQDLYQNNYLGPVGNASYGNQYGVKGFWEMTKEMSAEKARAELEEKRRQAEAARKRGA